MAGIYYIIIGALALFVIFVSTCVIHRRYNTRANADYWYCEFRWLRSCCCNRGRPVGHDIYVDEGQMVVVEQMTIVHNPNDPFGPQPHGPQYGMGPPPPPHNPNVYNYDSGAYAGGGAMQNQYNYNNSPPPPFDQRVGGYSYNNNPSPVVVGEPLQQHSLPRNPEPSYYGSQQNNNGSGYGYRSANNDNDAPANHNATADVHQYPNGTSMPAFVTNTGRNDYTNPHPYGYK